jgi:hypothetical protein
LSLCDFPWAFLQRTKSAVKIHTFFNHSAYLPAFVAFTDNITHESKLVKCNKLSKGTIVAEDRAFKDTKWSSKLQENRIFFITR